MIKKISVINVYQHFYHLAKTLYFKSVILYNNSFTVDRIVFDDFNALLKLPGRKSLYTSNVRGWHTPIRSCSC